MATTTTATGTVPQLIVDAVAADLGTSFAALATFDTHGSEFISFQMSYTKGSETSVETSVEVLAKDRTDWLVVPVIQGGDSQHSHTATVNRAFQVFLGRDITQMRVMVKRTGVANGTTALQMWALLSAPTFPITGNVS